MHRTLEAGLARPLTTLRSAAALPLVAAWALLVGVSHALRPLFPIDETRYLSVAWEMWVRGDYLVPHLNGLPYSEKPPLLFWLTNLGWWAFGVSEWWPRLLPGLFALVNLFLTALLARRLWPDRPGMARLVPAVLLGLFAWSLYNTLIMFDMLVAFCALVALLGILEARQSSGREPRRLWAAWGIVGVALGLGLLAKGPVALLVPLSAALLEPWWSRGLPWTGSRLRWWLGLAGAVGLAVAIGLAWALPAAAAGGEAYGRAILAQTGERVVRALAHPHPWWWYLALLPVLLFPYSVWPPLWKAAARMRHGRLDAGQRFCLAWLVPGLVVFSLISSKQPHYLLPIFPAFALLAGRLLAERPEVRRWHLAPPLSALVLVGLIVLVGPMFAEELGLPAWADGVPPGIGVFLLLSALGFVVWFARIFPGRPAAPTLITFVFLLTLHVGFAGVARRAYDLEPISRYLSVLERQGRPIAFVETYHGQFHFLGRLERPFAVVPGGAEHSWLLGHPGGGVIQDLDYKPQGIGRVEFTQPFREGTLAVWGLEDSVNQ